MKNVTVKLRTSLTSHKGVLTEIVFKEPTARLYMKYGDPFRVVSMPDGGAFTDFFNGPLMSFMSEMSDLDAITLEDISSFDFIACRGAVVALCLGAGVDPASPTRA